jgi:hypothetical protein
MKKVALVLALAALGLGLGAAPALALYPPAQAVSALIPAGSTTVEYSAQDPISFNFRFDSWTLSQGDQRFVESLQIDKGIVTWISRHKNFADTEYTYQVHYRIYDPGRGAWKGGSWTLSFGWQREISQHQVKDGVVAWKFKYQVGPNPGDTLQTGVGVVTYDPPFGSWPLVTYWYQGNTSPENLRVKDGVVAYPLNPLNSPLHYAMTIYDRELHQWVDKSTQIRLLSEFDWMEIGDGTVHLRLGNPWPLPDNDDFEYYDPFNHTWNRAYDNWPNPLRRASFEVQPAAGYAPLWVCYWDTSFAMNSLPGTWTYNFGDGMVSGNRSWVHHYWNAGTFPVSLSVDIGGQSYLAAGRTVQTQNFIPPTGGVTINGGAAYTDSLNVTLQFNYSQSATEMRFMNLPGFFEWSAWEAVVPGKAWQLSSFGFYGQPLDGVKTVYVKFRDQFGTESPDYQASITLDLTPPAPMLVLNYGHDTTRDRNIRAEWNAIDANGVGKMRYTAYNEEDFYLLWTPWLNYSATITTMTFSNKPGKKTVIVQFEDVAGNVTQVQDSVNLLSKALPFLMLLLE